ncbi:MAG: hypothetical protein EXS13_11300 [Planctomycetes bacterium]|nr:hypothetical protein [Planctomycetota bacterium]
MTRVKTAYQRLPTRIDGLDLLLGGGLRCPDPGSVFMVILGGPGTGKTHLALELAVRTLGAATERGACHIYYSFDQSPAELHSKLREDFDFYGLDEQWRRIVGTIDTPDHAAQIHEFAPPAPAPERYLALASLRESPHDMVHGGSRLFERLDRDLAAMVRSTAPVGTHLAPRLVAIDNISINAFDDGLQARSALQSIRQQLAARRLHGIFVIETPGAGSDRAAFMAAEYAADVIIELGYHQVGDQFKERSIEISKARHQFYYRGAHHFSIVGRNEGVLFGGRGARPPGLHVYPSVPTLLSHLDYLQSKEERVAPRAPIPFGVGDLHVPHGSVTGLIGPPARATTAHWLALKFLLAGERDGLLISLRETREELAAVAKEWFGADSDRVACISFAPEYLSAGKFMKDLYDEILELERGGRRIERAALWGIGQLKNAFPLLNESRLFLPWLSAFLKRKGIASLLVEATHQMQEDGTVGGDSSVPGTVDHLLALVEPGTKRPELRLVRSLSARSAQHGRALPLPPDAR